MACWAVGPPLTGGGDWRELTGGGGRVEVLTRHSLPPLPTSNHNTALNVLFTWQGVENPSTKYYALH